MSEDKSLDLLGAGRIAKAIPATAWKRVVETACSTFEQFLAPLTETTGGLGRLIHGKFDRLVEAEKVLVAKTAASAEEKIKSSGRPLNAQFNPIIVCKIIEHAHTQVDDAASEMWANVLAREMTIGSVHPEIVDVLPRLTKNDAVLLLEIAKKQKDLGSSVLRVVNVLLLSLREKVSPEPWTFHHAMLERLGLIRRDNELGWLLSGFGAAFIRTVTPLENSKK